MDADILLIAPNALCPIGDYVRFTRSDSGCYNVQASTTYKQKMSRLKKEVQDHLNAGKTVFVFLTKEEKKCLANGVSSPRKSESNYSTENYSNYNFLPTDIGTLTSASGKYVQFSGSSTFRNFYAKFKDYLEYNLYIEDPNEAEIIFTGKVKTKVLGAVYKVGAGHLVTLPMVKFDEDSFTEVKTDENDEEKEFWNKVGLAFGNNLVQCLIEVDRKLSNDSEKTQPPEWVAKEEFIGQNEAKLQNTMSENSKKILKLEEENEQIQIKLEEESKLKDLLFEQSKPLENAIIKALTILGYQAENYDDGDLEMDQVITSPENNRYIGESEGKDNKDVSVTKFRQLQDALNADYARDEIEEKAFGILFGNAERFTDPAKRTLDFTTKCKSGAKREQIALVKTVDLYTVAKYLNENTNENFKKACRDSIHKNLGEMVIFPAIPKMK